MPDVTRIRKIGGFDRDSDQTDELVSGPRNLRGGSEWRRRRLSGTAIELPDGAVYLRDTNEALPQHLGYALDPMRDHKLHTGDYSIVSPNGDSLEDHVVVERKTLNDLVGCCTHSRSRWLRCLERMSQIPKAHVVIESSWLKLRGGSYGRWTKAHGNSVAGSLIAWSTRFPVQFHLAGTRDAGVEVTEWILRRALIDWMKDAA